MKYGIYANEEEVVGGARCCFSISVFCLFVCLFFFLSLRVVDFLLEILFKFHSFGMNNLF